MAQAAQRALEIAAGKKPGRGRVYQSITETIGDTPMVRLNRLAAQKGVKANIYAKLEFFNPIASVKDRIGVNMIESLERPASSRGEERAGRADLRQHRHRALHSPLRPRAIASFSPCRRTMSIERRKMLAFLGAELVLTEGPKGMRGAVARAEELQKEIRMRDPPAVQEPGQSGEIHRVTTAEEIWNDLDGKVDIFIAGVGTGGHITGVGQVLKSRNKAVKVIAIEPEDSPVLSGGNPGPHKIQASARASCRMCSTGRSSTRS